MIPRQVTYVAGDSPVHRADPRVKIAGLLAFSIAVLAVGQWWALLLLGCVVVILSMMAHIPASLMNRSLVPVYVLAAFAFLFNVIAHPGLEGMLNGAFFAIRMVVLVAASFVVCLTTTTSELLDAFRWFIEPLRRFRVPVDDIAFTLALAIRFIPVVELELSQIRAAQVSRGANSTGSLIRASQIWAGAFTALFVGLFRHADALATAMDARCYGAADKRTRLP